MNQSIERTALSNLITNEDYARKVIPFLKSDYFKVREERIVFEEIQKFVDRYKKIPTKTALEIEVENRKDLNQDDHDKIVKLITSLDSTDVDIEWLLETTEKFCKDKAIYNAIVEGVEIIDGKDKKRTPDAIPDILTDALAVSFAKEEDKNGNLPMQFQYDIVDNNGIQREQFDDEFFKLIGDILVEVMEEQIKDEPVNRKNSSK